MSFFVTGLDLGQAQDYTALVVAQSTGSMHDPRCESLPLVRCDVRFIERYDLGTSYQHIVSDVTARMKKIPQPNYLVVDETGVGRPVVEMLSHLRPHGITITGSGKPVLVAPMHANVPKRDLVGAAQVALQNKVLRIAKALPHADTLTKELLAFRAKISDAGRDTYSAWREKDHDDLVLACSMVAWFAREVLATMYVAELERRLDAMVPREYSISPI